MGSAASTSSSAGGLAKSATFRFKAIADQFTSLEQVQEALRNQGLESSNLIIAVDFTKSNEWTGKHSFGGRSLHALGGHPNPYEQAISIIGKTLRAFDDDQLIPCYGFGDARTSDRAVFSFLPGDQPCQGLESALLHYQQLAPHVQMAGPTSFAPAIECAMRIVAASRGQHHILLLIADGQVTRSVDLPANMLSPHEEATVAAITAATSLPLSIIMVGVGDGPWDVMKEFDDRLPQRAFDNFQFVNLTEVLATYAPAGPARAEAAFALRALMEIPDQYRAMQALRLLGAPAPHNLVRQLNALPPPLPPPAVPSSQYAGGWGATAPPTAPYPHAAPYAPSAPYPHAAHPAAPQAGDHGGAATAPRSAATNEMFLCPITQEVMTDPVVAADGHTYERSAIESWLQGSQRSPMTNAPLPHRHLLPNHVVRSAILEAQSQTLGF